MLGDIFKHWKIENKIIAVVSDNGSNIKSAISNYLQIFHLPCVAHTLNLIVTKSLTDVAELNDILKKCRALVNHFKHSSLACDKLRSVQEQMGLPNLKVKQEVVTRWNSCFHMLQRLLEIKNPLCVAVANLSKPPEFLNADDWEVINDCIKVLKQADDITRLLSSENYPTVSLLIPIIRGIQFALQNTTVVTNVGDSLKLKLLQTIHQRLGSFESSKTIAKATFLDPRFKKDGFGNEENANNAEKWVTDEIKLILSKKTESTASPQLKTNSDQTNQPSTEILNIWTHFDRKVSEKRHFSNSTTTAIIMIRQYLELPLQERNKNPLEFWTKHQILLPELSDNRQAFYVKHSVNGTYNPVSVVKKGRPNVLTVSALKQKYIEPIRIAKKKLENVRSLLPYIPSVYHPFYKSLQEDVSPDVADEVAELVD
ncbi:E3 SUMO-protein ligase ZBED1-like [Diabrotica undecimpunctata]|uniref:E3 SUMO-protein ligase ZBED1-like n=1 Tax=Diabrotica undecimpunctata TaxID=50387 RepID=UPI003B636131